MRLTNQQMREFHEDGYVIVRGAVPRLMIDDARRAINHHLGQAGLPPDKLTEYSARSYCPEITGTPPIVDLFNRTPLFDLVESMLGEGNLLPIKGAQIALRFPGFGSNRPHVLKGHLDGVGTGTNGIPKGEFHRGFAALVTVLAADVTEPWHGNFTVWPGSHHVAERYFRETSPQELSKGTPRFDLPREPVQVCGQAGDVCISHHQLIHEAAPNHGPNIRYAVIFRAAHKDTHTIGTDAMTDIWREWDGIRAAMQTA
jgi:hypothetical protein